MKIEDDFVDDDEELEREKPSFCLWHRVAIYGCLALALVTLVVFIAGNWPGR